MAIGERIKYIRNLKNFTQKYLGQLIGFPEKTADIRIAQYESGTRTPKADITKELAKALEVSPLALDVPNIDSELGLMHTLFALEDIYGLQAEEKDGETKLSFSNASVLRAVKAWAEQSAKLKAGEMLKSILSLIKLTLPLPESVILLD
jgi:transcriptional regulator with XRE-family HTH domain